jgi:hypothetical protein
MEATRAGTRRQRGTCGIAALQAKASHLPVSALSTRLTSVASVRCEFLQHPARRADVTAA